MSLDESSTEIVGVASAALTEKELPEYQKAALDGDAEAAFTVMMHYQMAALDRRNAEYWAQIAAENGSLEGAIRYAEYLLDFLDIERCRRARFWVKRAREIAGDNEGVRVKSIEATLAEKCSRWLSPP